LVSRSFDREIILVSPFGTIAAIHILSPDLNAVLENWYKRDHRTPRPIASALFWAVLS
jgi:hypothetical protein